MGLRDSELRFHGRCTDGLFTVVRVPHEKDKDIQAIVLHSLSSSLGRKAAPTFIRDLLRRNPKDEEVIISLCTGARDGHNVDAVPWLIQRLRDKNTKVLMFTLDALKSFPELAEKSSLPSSRSAACTKK